MRVPSFRVTPHTRTDPAPGNGSGAEGHHELRIVRGFLAVIPGDVARAVLEQEAVRAVPGDRAGEVEVDPGAGGGPPARRDEGAGRRPVRPGDGALAPGRVGDRVDAPGDRARVAHPEAERHRRDRARDPA